MDCDDLARRLAKAQTSTSSKLSIPGGCNCAYCQFLFKASIFSDSDVNYQFQVATCFPEDPLEAVEFNDLMDARATVPVTHHDHQWH